MITRKYYDWLGLMESASLEKEFLIQEYLNDKK